VKTTRRIKAVAATLAAGFLLAVAFTTTAQAGNGVPNGMTAQEWSAMQARDRALDRYYHIGAFSPRAEAQRAEERRGQALDRYYHLGRYAVVRVQTRFDWGDAGIGAGAMLGAVVLGLGLIVAVRRSIPGKPSTA
jgi:hypothetical protein